MKYPCWSEYDSVYDGVELEMHIVDHCNLNCAGCNHFCSLAEPFYISIESFTDQLKLVKEKIPSLKWLMLLGGEPTLHPQLLDLCIIARKLFPDITIEILSNGKDLSRVIDKRFEFDKLNILFTFATYNIEYNDQDLKQMCELKNNNKSWSRESFTQTLVDINGTQDMADSFFNQCHHQLPCFTLQDYKIFECPFAAHIRHFNKKFNTDIPLIKDSDYLDLKEITLDKLEYFAYQPKNICKYCKPGENWVWHLSNGSFEEYTNTMKELYFSDYERYEYIQNLHPIKLDKADPNFGQGIISKNDIRYNGKIDIIIPYYNISNEQIDRLLNSLSKQSIIQDCMIYLISDNSPNELYLITTFKSIRNLNVIFLKNTERKGPGEARNKGIKNSFNKYLLFIDSDDYLFDNYTLEQIYNIFINSNYDVIGLNRQNELGQRYNQQDFACTRDFLQKYNIQYGKYFLHEDLFFVYQLILYNANILNSVINGTIYERHQTNLSSTTTSEDKIISKYYTLYCLCKLFSNNYSQINNKKYNMIEDLLNQYSDIKYQEKETSIDISIKPELLENIYYILFKSLLLVKDIINIKNLNELLQNFLNNSIKIKGSSVNNFEDLEKKVVQCNFVKQKNNIFLYPIIKEFEGR